MVWPAFKMPLTPVALLSHQFPRNLLIHYLPHRQGRDDGVVVFEEAIYLAQGIFRLVEGDEEALFAPPGRGPAKATPKPLKATYKPSTWE